MQRTDGRMTKSQMIADINDVLRKCYGEGTRVSNKVERFSKVWIMRLHEVAYLNQNDPTDEQGDILVKHIFEMAAL